MLLVLVAGGCASSGVSGDPIEPVNRAVFGFNDELRDHLMDPVSTAYTTLVPGFARDGLRNVRRNLNSPIVLANDLLQGEFRRALETLGRFVVSTAFGLAGLVDGGTRVGIPYHDEDFGQTLGVWGVPPGPYLVLPFLGSSTLRDGGGMAVDSLISPTGLLLPQVVRLSLGAVGAVDGYSRVRGEVELMQETSLDFYAATRSLYLQYRAEQIRNGRDAVSPLDYELDPEDDGALDPDAGDEGGGAAAP